MRAFRVVALLVVIVACGTSTEPKTPETFPTGPHTAPLGRFALFDTLAGDRFVRATGATITFAADSSFIWDGPGFHRAGRWGGPLNEFIVSDTVPKGFVPIWFGVVAGTGLQIRSLNDAEKYRFVRQ